MFGNEKHSVALWSVIAAIFLTGMKLVVGFRTNSLGILSEAAHSGLDLVAAVITYFAIRMADRPPDREHNFGHGKIENFSALIETMLLLLTCVWIVYEAIHRMLAGGVHVDASPWAFGVIVVSVAIDFTRSRALKRVAIKYDSQALEADALHFSTDIWSSSVVLFGLCGVLVGEKFGVSWLAKADSVAALGVAVIVVWVGFQLIMKSVSELIDSVPSGMADKIEKAVKVPGAIAVRQIRMRKSGPTVFVDVRVAVENCLSIERTHEIADNIEDAVMAVAPGSDVVVHTEPADENPSDPAVIAKTLAQKYGMAAHSIRCSEDSPRTLELHLEVDRTLTLQAAHDKAERFEREFVDKQPDFSRVISHIEPAETNHSYIPVGDDMNERILESANGFFRDNGVPCNAHEISVSRRGDKLSISLHCEMEGNISIVEAHELSSRLELHLRKKAPTVRHVTIHVEPLKSA